MHWEFASHFALSRVGNSDLLKGVNDSLFFYAVGSFLTALAYFVFENSYAHAPHFYMIIALVFVAVGGFIGLMSLIKYVLATRHQRLLGALVIHLFVLTSFLLWIYLGLVNRS